MTKTEFTAILAQKNAHSVQHAEKILNAVLDSIEDCLARGDRLVIPGFGIFDVHQTKEHKGRNPASGEEITIQATKVPRFRAGEALKKSL